MFKSLFGRKKDTPVASAPEDLLVIEQTVDAPIDRAFAVFVEEFGRWWPREYTLSGDNLEEIGIEPKYEDHCFERTKDGETLIWGTVLTVARPEHIVFAWQLSADRSPIENLALASRVDIRFTSATADTTNVLLVHRDFPRHGPGWQQYRSNMASRSGWPKLIDLYAKAVASPP